MTGLVTLDEARLYCRIDATDEDAALLLMIAAASEAVRDAFKVCDGNSPNAWR